ncbi:MAG: hypothetical protein PHV37_08920 [Candidatus Gastranaerophilales bacterium]|nr:hypothetical protein [Candidatus Gastranaerophilales bacterium]
MKKLLTALTILTLMTLPAFAEPMQIKVKAISYISTKTPTPYINVTTLADATLPTDLFLPKGTILYGNMIDIVQPQKYGKNATFSFQLTEYKKANGIKQTLAQPIILKYKQQMRPNFERSTFSVEGNNGWATEFSPHDITLMKESTSPVDFLKKEMIKDSIFDTGWQIELKPGNTLFFKYEN